MDVHALIAATQAQLDTACRELKALAVDFSVPDETLIERRASALRLHHELLALDQKMLKGSFWRFLKFW
jgi:hypothetical protein